QRDDGHGLAHAGDADAVITDGSDDAGAVRAVTRILRAGRIVWIFIVIQEVPAMDVVHEAVTVVVDAVARDFAGVLPDIGLQVRVPVVDTGIDAGDGDRAATDTKVPRFRGAHFGQGPLLAELGVVGRGKRVDRRIRDHVGHVGAFHQAGQSLGFGLLA